MRARGRGKATFLLVAVETATHKADQLEKLTHAETKKVEDLSAAKEKEVLEIK
ncbi:MAG TPA: hypothetical protein VGT03_01295 [Candidatus Acidoferrales bacterium]|nr:hypothetical protein [Candidatus Acidoferrales bacterium]